MRLRLLQILQRRFLGTPGEVAAGAAPTEERKRIISLARFSLAAARLDAFRQRGCSSLTEEEPPLQLQLQELQQQAATRLLQCIRVLQNEQQAMLTLFRGAAPLLFLVPTVHSEHQTQEKPLHRQHQQAQQQQQQLIDAAARLLRLSRSSANCVRSFLRSLHTAHWPLNPHFAETVFKLLAIRAAAAATTTAAAATGVSGNTDADTQSGTVDDEELGVVADMSLFAAVLTQKLQGHAGGEEKHAAATKGTAIMGTTKRDPMCLSSAESAKLLRCMDGIFDLLSRLVNQQQQQQQQRGRELKQQQHHSQAAAFAARTAWGWLRVEHLAALLRASEWRLLHATTTPPTTGNSATLATTAPEENVIPSRAADFQAVAATTMIERLTLSSAEAPQQDWMAKARDVFETAWQLLLLEAAQPSRKCEDSPSVDPLPLGAYLDLKAAFHNYKTAEVHPNAVLLPASFAAAAAGGAETGTDNTWKPSGDAEAEGVSILLRRMTATAVADAAGIVRGGNPTAKHSVQEEPHILDLPTSQSTFHFYRLRLRVADDGQHFAQQKNSKQQVQQQHPQLQRQPQQHQGRVKHWLSPTPLDLSMHPLLHHYLC